MTAVLPPIHPRPAEAAVRALLAAAGLPPVAAGGVAVRRGHRPRRRHRPLAPRRLAAAAAGPGRRGGRAGPGDGAVRVRATGCAAPVAPPALGATVPGGRPRRRTPGLRPEPAPHRRLLRSSRLDARLPARRRLQGDAGSGRRPGAGRTAAAARALADFGRREGTGVARLPSAIIEPRSRRPTDRFRIAPPPIRPAATATARAASRPAR